MLIKNKTCKPKTNEIRDIKIVSILTKHFCKYHFYRKNVAKLQFLTKCAKHVINEPVHTVAK